MFPPYKPRTHRVLNELYGLVFYVAERRSVQIADKVRRNTEDAAYFVDLVLARFEKLCVFGRNAYRVVFHPFFEYRHLMAVPRPLIYLVPRLSQFLWVFQNAGMFENTARSRSVAKELCAVLLGGERQSDSLTCLRNRAQSEYPVDRQTFDVEHLIGRIYECLILYIVGVCVLYPSRLAVALDRH